MGLIETGERIARNAWRVPVLGRILAWDQLRASGRSGAATADALIAFAERSDWVRPMLDAALEMTQQTEQQWQSFVKAIKG